MFYPVERDRRFTISREWIGKEKPYFVARFCGEWIGASAFYTSAAMLAIGESARRRGALLIEAVE